MTTADRSRIAEGYCACGKPLHYTDEAAKAAIDALTAALLDDHIEVTNMGDGRRYRVQRHYIALHGIRAHDLAQLALDGVIEPIERADR